MSGGEAEEQRKGNYTGKVKRISGETEERRIKVLKVQGRKRGGEGRILTAVRCLCFNLQSECNFHNSENNGTNPH